ncbi:endonuclease/exonuclease/phosphatase family protein [Nocardioides marmoriginsengisoli]|uniref:Endonuclease/exonuclease/phosphatase family protein n=1 Tax=Nocardioides marmoriginsengisoli TaxID=661483 RepID=A0A3N0CTF9_9ACTN|nr:endonuclease/exonuclease/phosphatase family protein [Nocardioides marmoriginsengisoli]RNL66233.1 endonuclease/exonuclease/phosphatase family protein [Nocardioides marmoriginsengisoli]
MPERRAPRVLRGATFNILRRDPEGRQALANQLKRYCEAHHLDFVLLQEIAGHHAALRTIEGYDLIAFPATPDRGDNGILVRHAVPHGPGMSIAVKSYWFTRKGKRFPARSIVSVGLSDWLRVTTVHAPVQVLNHSSRFRGAARRITAYRRTAAALVKHARRVANRTPGVALVIAGDWNAGTAAYGVGTPSWVARKAGMKKHRVVGARIDWPMSRGCHLDDIEVDRTPHNLGSDHPIVRFTVTED